MRASLLLFLLAASSAVGEKLSLLVFDVDRKYFAPLYKAARADDRGKLNGMVERLLELEKGKTVTKMFAVDLEPSRPGERPYKLETHSFQSAWWLHTLQN